MIKVYNQDNMAKLKFDNKFDLIYADCIYESHDFDWVDVYWPMLKDNGVFILQTDYHTVAEYKVKLDKIGIFINWLIYINDWGGTPKKGFPQKHDDILVYSNGNDWAWEKGEIQIPKVTAGTSFDKKGTGMKTPCSVFYDHASFSTMANERIKDNTGHNIRWMKPAWLSDRILRPFTKEGDWILEPFGGTFSACRWAKVNNRNAIGIELDRKIFNIGAKEIKKLDEV